MNHAAHTSLPWHRAGMEIHDRQTFFDESGARIGDTPCSILEVHLMPKPGEAEANLDFILRACNSHYDMVEALEYARDEIALRVKEDGGTAYSVEKACRSIDAAIAKATA